MINIGNIWICVMLWYVLFFNFNNELGQKKKKKKGPKMRLKKKSKISQKKVKRRHKTQI
jgi:hypothetical protein